MSILMTVSKPYRICDEHGCNQKIYPFNGIYRSRFCPQHQLINTKIKPKSKIKAVVHKKEKVPKNGLKQPNKANLEKQLDAAWSKSVKIRAGNKCEVCGKTRNLNSHHLFSRAKKSVRWDMDNGICLCVGCHVGSNWSAHKTPILFNKWLLNYKGDVFIDWLTIKANSTGKYTVFEKEIMLDELNKLKL